MIKVPFSVLSLASLLLAAGSSLAQAAPEPAILDALGKVMLECPERVWPNYNWKKFMVVEIAEDGSSHVMSGATGKIIALEAGQLPDNLKDSPYGFISISGTPALTLSSSAYEAQFSEVNKARTSPEQMLATMIDLGAHESFHRVGQAGWVPRESGRGTELPIQALPRIYRRAIFNHLSAAFKEPTLREEELAKANYWFQKWKQEFPSEVKASTDTSEGTAQYAGIVTTSLSRVGCAASEDILREEVKKVVVNGPDSFLPGKFTDFLPKNSFALDSEGYDLGGLATLLLRFDEKNTSWQQKMAEGVSPLEVLLDGRAAKESEFDPALRAEYESAGKEKNAEAYRLVQPAISALEDPRSVIVAIPNEWTGAGSFSPYGFYYEAKLGLYFVPMRLPISFAATNQSTVVAATDSVMIDGLSTSPCGTDRGYWYTALPASAVKTGKKDFELRDKHVKGRLRGELKRAKDGRQWLCGVNAK